MPAPTGAVTLAFTDIPGSTELWERLGRAFEPTLALHHKVIRERLAACNGHEVKTEGDAFMLAFARPSDAVRFALDAQAALHAVPWPAETGELLVRIGLHCGEPICAPDPAGRMDYFGPMVNRAARIAAAAHGGQILISEALRAAAGEVLSSAEVRDLGEHRLKGLERPERLFQAMPKSLAGRAFGPLRTLSAAATNLPAQASSFVGRERELRELAELVPAENARLVTITGPAGTGKTRLALRLGSDLLEKFRGGVWHVEAAEAATAADLGQAVGRVLGVTPRAGEPPEKVVGDVLEFREPLLLILDNLDQSAGAAEATVGKWRQRAPQSRFLVTCRSILGLAGEREFGIEPLPVPPKSDAARAPAVLAACDSVRLFLDRAREADARFQLTAENAADIATICAGLEGIPLAIELAAARVRIMKPAQIVAKLGQRFDLLRSARAGVPARQQTLQGAIEWSYQMLTPWECAAFEQLCVFRGGFYLDAAEAVLDLSAFPDAPPAMDAVQRLRERSFLRAWETPWETRFGMFASMREFGEKRLGERSKEAGLRHAAHYVEYTESWWAQMKGATAREAIERLEAELENGGAAIDRFLAAGRAEEAGRTALAMRPVYIRRGRADAGSAWLLRAAEALGPAPTVLRARLLAEASDALSSLGDMDRSESSGDAAIAAARAADDEVVLCRALDVRGGVARARGDLALSERLLSESHALHTRAGRTIEAATTASTLGLTLMNLGRREEALKILLDGEKTLRASGRVLPILNNIALLLHRIGDTRGAIARLEEAERLARDAGDLGSVSTHLMNRGRFLMDLGDMEQALACFAEGEGLKRQLGEKAALAYAIRSRGNAYRRLGEYERALKCYEESEVMERALGNKPGIHAQLRSRGHVHVLRGEVSKAAACYEEAAVLSREMKGSDRLTSFGDLAGIALARRQMAEALSLAEEAVRLAREMSDRNFITGYLCQLGESRMIAGDLAGAASCAEESEAISRETGSPLSLAGAMSLRAMIQLKLGQPAAACESAAAALDQFTRSGSLSRITVLQARTTLAVAEAALGRNEDALRSAEEAWKLADRLNLREDSEDAGVRECLAELKRIAPRA